MKPIVEKILRSGLIDKMTVELMEKAGALPDGSSDLVNEDALNKASYSDKKKLADELEQEVEESGGLKESMLDLDKLQWPVKVWLKAPPNTSVTADLPSSSVDAVIDRMGRYYFRIQDINELWFVPGFILQKRTPEGALVEEVILESQVLFTGNQKVCIQVSTTPYSP